MGFLSRCVTALVLIGVSPAVADVTLQFRLLGLSAGTVILGRNSPDFAEDTARYSAYDAPTFSVYVKPATEADVQKLVGYASSVNFPFLSKSGGHGFATSFGRLQNGLQIDMGSFDTISIDQAASTATIGGGVLIGNVAGPLYDAGKELQTGSQKCVGLVGATLGGGVGRLNGLRGMIIDALLSVRMVTASGEIVTASKTENSDLFWGIRGAGFQFGIVLEATYQVYDLSNGGNIVNADFLFSVNETTAIFNYFKSLQYTLPAELALIFQTGYDASLGGQYAVVNAAYSGSVANARTLLQPLIDTDPIRQNITLIPYNELIDASFFGTSGALRCTKDTLQSVYGLGLKSYDIPTFQQYMTNLTHLFETQPDARGSVFFIEAFPMQAARAVPDSETAYPHRDINAHLLFNYGYTDASLDSIIDAFAVNARNEFAVKSGFGSIETYVSYGHGDEGPVPLYASRKLGPLRALKELWDPQQVFSFNEPLW